MSGSNAFRRQLGLRDADVLVLYAGNMGEKQGLELLIDSARRLVASHPDVRVALAGAGSARQRLKQLAEGLGNVVWLPLQPADRFNELLNAADIHVLPQRADAADLVMPSKLTGMLASGRATVGTAAPDTQLGQVLAAAGRRVDPGDAGALATALGELARDATARAALGRQGRLYAETHLALDAIMAGFEAELRVLVSRPGPCPARPG